MCQQKCKELHTHTHTHAHTHTHTNKHTHTHTHTCTHTLEQLAVLFCKIPPIKYGSFAKLFDKEFVSKANNLNSAQTNID